MLFVFCCRRRKLLFKTLADDIANIVCLNIDLLRFRAGLRDENWTLFFRNLDLFDFSVLGSKIIGGRNCYAQIWFHLSLIVLRLFKLFLAHRCARYCRNGCCTDCSCVVLVLERLLVCVVAAAERFNQLLAVQTPVHNLAEFDVVEVRICFEWNEQEERIGVVGTVRVVEFDMYEHGVMGKI